MTDLVELTIQEAGGLLRRRAISSTDLVAASIARIEETEPVLHAYATVLAESAREEAKQADKELAAGNWRGRLHGIPIGVKDLFYTRGVPTEAGSRVLAGFVPTYDATAVRLLREAGAVVLGKTVTNEFAYGLNVPPTRNPWNLGYYPGGSSAGSGVATAVGAAFGAIGTDTGGSIRVPAAINGLAGLKPTLGLVSRHGVVPLSTSMDHAGPMARSVVDCSTRSIREALIARCPTTPPASRAAQRALAWVWTATTSSATGWRRTSERLSKRRSISWKVSGPRSWKSVFQSWSWRRSWA
jgi:Asp-tRNA(Asn)/Glu-tRNA(Gln) amidotransferase A subunit family amidase